MIHEQMHIYKFIYSPKTNIYLLYFLQANILQVFIESKQNILKLNSTHYLCAFSAFILIFFLDACSLCDIICDWTCWLPDPSICRPAYTILATFVGTCFWPQHVALCYTDNSYSAGQGLYVYCFILNYILWAHFTLLFESYLLK